MFAFGTFALVQSWPQSNSRTRLIGIYLLVSFGLAVVGSAAAGAAVNHYLEPALAMAVLLPTGLAYLEPSSKSSSPLQRFAIALILFLFLPSLDIQRWNMMHSKAEDLRRIVNTTKDKHVFTDIPYVAARSSTPQLVDLASLINTELIGGWAGWSSRGLVKLLEEKKYELVVLSQPVEKAPIPSGRYPRAPRLDAAIQTAIAGNYSFCFEFDSSYFYAPLGSTRNSVGITCPSQPALSNHSKSAIAY